MHASKSEPGSKLELPRRINSISDLPKARYVCGCGVRIPKHVGSPVLHAIGEIVCGKLKLHIAVLANWKIFENRGIQIAASIRDYRSRCRR
jgi:hypothetical protein